MKWVSFVLLAALAYCQYHLWLSPDGWQNMTALEQQLQAQEARNLTLAVRNTALAAEVTDLAEGTEAIAEIARVDLGYIGQGETFYRLVKQ
ncbi:septum formation initiator family protein [Neisseria leonii]|uniref:septum formation initiator family protein n=1 Tax=Neisseria leonii TaxID=2995413 RepID=UPI00237C517F|nr:septum formation initiator family protein [Neisseria sp. 3986]MDD9325257.1 septum formation initiator family protein [Neisseria sp. 3986]